MQKVFYLHGDHLGSTSLTTDSNGAVVSECRYYPYGQERGCTGEDKTDFGFTGQRNEGSFDLMDYNARYYSPRLGRFVSPDSVIADPLDSNSYNRYAYVNNNPIRYTDPTGHYAFEENPDDPFILGQNHFTNFSSDRKVTVQDLLLPFELIYGGAVLHAGGAMVAEAVASTVPYLIGATQAACADGDCTNEANFTAKGIGEVEKTITKVFRVEGNINARISILENGTVEISGNKTLFLNFGDKQRALEFFEKRISQGMEGVSIKTFDVPSKFVDNLRSLAVPEQLVREFPNSPIVVDMTKAVDQFGLRPEQIQQLINVIIQGSGQTHP